MTFGAHIPGVQLTDGHRAAALDLAGLQAGEQYLELGSGIGRGLVAAARRGASARGVELLEDACTQSRAAARAAGVADQVEVIRGDLLEHDVSDADVILLHLGPAFHDLLATHLAPRVADTVRIVACGWPVEPWIPRATTIAPEHPAWRYEPRSAAGALVLDASPVRACQRAGSCILGVRARAGIDLEDLVLEVGTGSSSWQVHPSGPRWLAAGQGCWWTLSGPANTRGAAGHHVNVRAHARLPALHDHAAAATLQSWTIDLQARH